MMEASLLYNLHGLKLDPKIPPLTHFEEAYTTTNKMVRVRGSQGQASVVGSPISDTRRCARCWILMIRALPQVRIYKVLDVSEESKTWRKTHGPGYPPQLDDVIKTAKAFQQIHGF